MSLRPRRVSSRLAARLQGLPPGPTLSLTPSPAVSSTSPYSRAWRRPYNPNFCFILFLPSFHPHHQPPAFPPCTDLAFLCRTNFLCVSQEKKNIFDNIKLLSWGIFLASFDKCYFRFFSVLFLVINLFPSSFLLFVSASPHPTLTSLLLLLLWPRNRRRPGWCFANTQQPERSLVT